MKKSVIFIVLFATFLFGCKEQQKATKYNNDDVYSSSHDYTKSTPRQKIQDEDLSASRQITSPDSSSSLNATSAKSVPDLSDNSYAARIKRFNDKNPGLAYNDEYYTSSVDSINSGGSSPDVNIYLGSTWGSSYWGPSFSFGWGFGWGDCWGYPYSWWDYPYYGYYPYYWGYPYYGYPYYYYDYPYWGYYNDYYYGYGDNSGNYYGPRRTLSSTDGGRNTRGTTNGPLSNTEQERNTRTDLNPGKINHSTDQTRSGRSEGYTAPAKQRYSYTSPRTNENTRMGRDYPGIKPRFDRAYAQKQQPAPRYSKPGNEQVSRSSTPQTYSSPAYRQPKSSQEYINPRTQQGNQPGVKANPGTRSHSNPGTSGRHYSSPGNSGSGYRSAPGTSGSGGSRNYSSPQRSSSSPGYSSPSRSSSPGYSAPSRSSSPSGGSSGGAGRSGGGSGGGGRSGGGGGSGRR